MPREQINYPKHYGDTGEPIKDTGGIAIAEGDSPIPTEVVLRTSPTLHVSWHKDCWIQLCLEGDLSYFRFAADNPDATDDRSTVYTEPLGRDEINKLIRSLRRARDQVFGRDE